jgi:C4-dicarboxylate-specific signal transduction histidine kinase
VLLNLVRNAVEAVHDSGVTTANIAIKVRKMKNKNMALITVQDNGPGFDDETAKRIFEPFFTTKTRGIGMGLAISRSLIEANGGKLWHDLDTDSGAKIHFTLPFAA